MQDQRYKENLNNWASVVGRGIYDDVHHVYNIFSQPSMCEFNTLKLLELFNRKVWINVQPCSCRNKSNFFMKVSLMAVNFVAYAIGVILYLRL